MKKQNNDKMILDLKKRVEEKKKLLKSIGRFSPKTNCSLLIDGERFNLNVVSQPALLFLIAKLQSLKSGLFEIIQGETLEIGGYSVDLWLEDLVSRFNILNRNLEAERLKVLEEKLHNLLSLDKKVELEIKDLESQI